MGPDIYCPHCEYIALTKIGFIKKANLSSVKPYGIKSLEIFGSKVKRRKPSHIWVKGQKMEA